MDDNFVEKNWFPGFFYRKFEIHSKFYPLCRIVALMRPSWRTVEIIKKHKSILHHKKSFNFNKVKYVGYITYRVYPSH